MLLHPTIAARNRIVSIFAALIAASRRPSDLRRRVGRGFIFVMGLLLLLCLQSPAQAAAAKTVDIPKNLSTEDAIGFVAGLTDAQARVLLLQRLEAAATAKSSGQSGPSGLAVVMVRTRIWLESKALLLRSRVALLDDGLLAAPASLATAFLGLSADRGWGGFVTAVAMILLALLLGMAANMAMVRLTAGMRRSLETSGGRGVVDRFCRLALRLALDIGGLIVFALVIFALTSLVYADDEYGRIFVSGYVTVGLITLATAITARFFLAPKAPELRLLPMGDEIARDIYATIIRLAWVGGVLWTTTAFVYLNTDPPFGVHLVFVLISGGASLALVLGLIWRLRQPVATALSGQLSGPGEAPRSGAWQTIANKWHVFAISYIVVIAALWVGAMLTSGHSVLWPALGSLAIVAFLPVMDHWLKKAVDGLIDALVVDHYATAATPAGSEDGAPLVQIQTVVSNEPNRYARVIMRGARTGLVILAMIAVLQLWNIDVLRAFGAPGGDAIWAAVFNVLVVFLLAYIIWQLAETAMGRRHGADKAAAALPPEVDQAAQEAEAIGEVELMPSISPSDARARTLLPLIRKFILIILAVMVVMISLSSIGVDIGPLMAGAGVIGLAIGFGAQTLVRDVVAGVFFLIDDAFRIGEYIEMDELRGEVEGITLRSLKLRHHRGAVQTIPFGELRYIKNYNRDWTIYKMPIRVPAETDPQAVKKIIKKIGKEMLEDPEHGPNFIEPLKSQGVYAVDDDSALIMRVKFMCKPREQFVLRREAYHRIRKAFAEAGIEFARRKVEVSMPEGAKPEIAKSAAAAAVEDQKPVEK